MKTMSITSNSKSSVISLLLNGLPYPDTLEECNKYYKSGLMKYTGGFIDEFEWNKLKFFGMSLDEQIRELIYLYKEIADTEIQVCIDYDL